MKNEENKNYLLGHNGTDGCIHADGFYSRCPAHAGSSCDVYTPGYPTYLLPFIGIAKILAVLTILIPGFSALKEWAYAGLVFDLVGAWYSHFAVGDLANVWIFAVIALLMVLASYFLYKKIGRSLPDETGI